MSSITRAPAPSSSCPSAVAPEEIAEVTLDTRTFGSKRALFDAVLDEWLLAALPEQFGIASHRISGAAEVAALTVFLASFRAANVLGADLVIDGGISKTI
ncbi:hypothetical protein [Nocardia fluminea]|uniref:hypothetical protein n=1 Tax=Nocardia fluminea TaxID=134984 RepID=UPI003D09DA36